MAGPFIFKTASGGSPSLLRMKAIRNAINRLVLWRATVQSTYKVAIRPRSETDVGMLLLIHLSWRSNTGARTTEKNGRLTPRITRASNSKVSRRGIVNSGRLYPPTARREFVSKE